MVTAPISPELSAKPPSTAQATTPHIAALSKGRAGGVEIYLKFKLNCRHCAENFIVTPQISSAGVGACPKFFSGPWG
jgi:hypothetical protein